jgi:transposase
MIISLDLIRETHRCGGCGKKGLFEYDSHEQAVRHLLWWQGVTVVRFRRYRVSCPECGNRTEALDFVTFGGLM